MKMLLIGLLLVAFFVSHPAAAKNDTIVWKHQDGSEVTYIGETREEGSKTLLVEVLVIERPNGEEWVWSTSFADVVQVCKKKPVQEPVQLSRTCANFPKFITIDDYLKEGRRRVAQ